MSCVWFVLAWVCAENRFEMVACGASWTWGALFAHSFLVLDDVSEEFVTNSEEFVQRERMARVIDDHLNAHFFLFTV